MATLQSPGVQVNIINESFYTPAAPGTVPLIFVASASNKTNPSGVTAQGTDPANDGKVWSITSQRDLTDTFGVPKFYTDATQQNTILGGELNEYGLQAAYSLLGVSSAAFVVRAPIDLSSLIAVDSTPTGAPANGSYWLDTSNTLFGLFEWDNATGSFTNEIPLLINDSNSAVATVGGDGVTPKPSFGLVGKYAITVTTEANTSTNSGLVWYKNSNGNWVQVGSVGETNFTINDYYDTFISTVWSTSRPAVVGKVMTAFPSGTITINGVSISYAGASASELASDINDAVKTRGVGAKVSSGAVELYVDNRAFGGTSAGVLTVGGDTTLLGAMGITADDYVGPTVFVGAHTQYPNFSTKPSGSVYMKTTSPNTGANWTVKRYSATSQAFNTITAPIYKNGAESTYQLDKVSGGANIPVGTLFIESNFNHGDGYNSTSTNLCRPIIPNFRIMKRVAVSPTTITSGVTSSTVTTSTIQISVTKPQLKTYTAAVGVTFEGGQDALVEAINASGIPNLSATSNDNNTISIIHTTGGEIAFIDYADHLGTLGFTKDVTANYYSAGTYEPAGFTSKASNWMPLDYTSSNSLPSSTPANGKLWYSSIIDQVDILWHDGDMWKGYGNAFPATDPAGPIVSATKPTTQSDGTTALADGDIWISITGSDLEVYGHAIYVYNGSTLEWVAQDVSDQTSPTGWLFADARWAMAGSSVDADSIPDLRGSDYVDPDCPDPVEYPRGMRLWNTRRSGFNIKKYVVNHIDINENNGVNLRVNEPMNGSNQTTPYNPDRWVTVSPNNADGSGTFGRKAQRSFVVSSLKALIDSNLEIRDTDTNVFNLIAAPGYPEAISNMINLNVDRGQTAFVIGDTPFRLKATSTELKAYALNSNHALDNGEVGLVSYNEYMAAFYPSGYTTDLNGKYIVVPPSHMMLRTIATSDQKSYPWFAPAGIRRGVVDNVTSVGYIENGEFKPAALPQAVRDTMAQNGHINPIATITGAGIINFGQYTRANAASSLDRINVSRLVAYLRRQLDVLSRPYLFEPNDKITRNEIKNAVQSLLLELVGQRALYDFIVVCDESNNTPARIDRSELWVDVAIEPVKAVEFIYIPVRLVNTGSIKAGTYTLA
jgi:hypothetical protein